MRRLPRWPLAVLAVLLIAIEPLAWALRASAIVDRVAGRGWPAVSLLAGRLVVTSIGIAAGLALWRDRPWAVRFARLAIVLSAGVTLLAALTHALPPGAPPGLATPILLATLAWDAAWILYLTLLDRRDFD